MMISVMEKIAKFESWFKRSGNRKVIDLNLSKQKRLAFRHSSVNRGAKIAQPYSFPLLFTISLQNKDREKLNTRQFWLIADWL